MNDYHLYEEIGQGKFSTVYKGRKRHTIRYVAVKSIEKSRRDKVMAEVNTLSQLSHPNIVGFHNWYETRNHLWIIFEYCAGGDVMRLLKQDGRLPEDQVRWFGRDICAGLLHVHARSIIYSDLKPANVLFNEDGVLKLSDFGCAQKLAEIQRNLEEQVPLPRRGTPNYMAPELLHDGGMHSFASDLWATGCVIHEMLAGRAPFQASSFAQLQHMVMHDPAPLPTSASPETQALLAALLRKGPLDRPSWGRVRSHAFWRGRPPGDEADADLLPQQPHFDELQRMWQRVSCQAPAAPSDATHASPAFAPPCRGTSDTAAKADASHGTPSKMGTRRGEGTTSPGQELSPELHDEYTRLAQRRGEHAHCGPESPQPTELECAQGREECQAPAVPTVAKIPQPSINGHGLSTGSLRNKLGASVHARVRELLLTSEMGVRPISRNPQIEEPEVLDTVSHLPFAVLKFEEVCSKTHAELESFLTQVYKCVAQGPLEQRLNALKYLEQICGHMHVADLVVNSNLFQLVLRMLLPHGGKSRIGSASPNRTLAPPAWQAPAVAGMSLPAALRARLLALIGQLLRHATYLDQDVIEMGLFDVLLEGFQEDNLMLKRRATAALGELLFYIATQPMPSLQSGGNGNGNASVEGCGIESRIPPKVFSNLNQLLLTRGADEVSQHYTAKTLENIATQRPAVARRWFFSTALLQALKGHALHSATDTFRLSCLAVAVHLVRDCEVADVAALVDPGLVSLALSDLAPQGVPQGLQLVGVVVLRGGSGEAVFAALPDNIIELLMRILSQPRYNSTLRGRSVVILATLFSLDNMHEARRLRLALDQAFTTHVDRLGREKDRVVVQCVGAAAAIMEVVAMMILKGLVEGLRQLPAATAAAEIQAAEQVKLLPVFLHLVASASLCGCLLGAQALPLLGAICELAGRLDPTVSPGLGQLPGGIQQLQPLVLMIMEALSTQQALVLEHASQVARCILPALAALLSSSRNDVRLLALKSFSGISIMFINDIHVFNPRVEKPTETTLLLQALLCTRVLPVLPTLLHDEPPAPSYVLRLVAALLSCGCDAASKAVRELGLAKQLLVALKKQQALTLHAAILAHSLLRAREIKVRDLDDAGVLAAVHTTLSEAAEAFAGHPAQIDFAMVDAALCLAEEVLGQVASTMRMSPGVTVGDDSQQPHLAAGPLLATLPSFAMLCVPLAASRLATLLDRATACCQHLAAISCSCGAEQRRVVVKLSLAGVGSLLQTLVTVAHWRHSSSNGPHPAIGDFASTARTLQRRVLAVLASPHIMEDSNGEIHSEVAAGMERLFSERLLGDDPSVLADAKATVASAKAAGLSVGSRGV